MGAPCIVTYTSNLLKEEAQKITDRFKELVGSGLSEREAGIKVATEQHKILNDKLNTFKKSIGVKETEYKPFDNSKEIQAVHDKYNPLIEAAKQKANEIIPENKVSDPTEEKIIAEEVVDKPIGESGEGGGGKKPPIDNDFVKMTSSIPNSGEVKKYLSGDTIKKYEQDADLRNNQDIVAQELEPALKHGIETIEKAKEIFGDNYVNKTLEYIKNENIPIENKALLYVSLENEVAKRLLTEPDNLQLKKLQDLVRTESQAYLRSNALAINMGRLRKFAETGYDISQVTDKFFTSKEVKDKVNIEKLVQADAETIQKQYEEQFNEKVEEAAEKLRATERAKERTGRKQRVHKAIDAAMEKWAKKLSADLPDGTQKQGFGDLQKVFNSVGATMKAAYDAGIAVEKAVQEAIDFITEKLGKDVWSKIDVEEFRKDNESQLRNGKTIDIEAQQKRQAAKEYQMLETERNRQLKRVGDLTERLKSLQAGVHPETGAKTTKLDVPEIEALKEKVKDESKKLNAIEAQQKRVDDLEVELERLQNRLPKEKNETVKRQISAKEQEIKTRIEAEKETIRKENKANNELRLSDAKEAVKQRIEKIKTEIANKERELVEKNKPINEDLELARLKEIEKSITELRDKYLPEEKDPYEAEKQRERVKDKLVSDIITLNEQINTGERSKKADTPNYENDAEINKLKEIRENKKAILNEIDPLAIPKEKTIAERTTDAENNLQKRIDAVREEILSGERDEKKSKSVLQSKKLEQLREQKKSLEALRDKYLPKGKDPYADKKTAKAVEDKLVKENIELNRQIAKGEKDIKEGKESLESKNIDKLKAERDGRKEILEALDPTPKIYVENALIEQGFGKTIKVKNKNGVEERQVLDWTKLAGEERSIDKISKNVAKALEKSGFTIEQLERMQDAFIKEYNEVSENVIKKGLNEIATRNKTTVTPDQKSAAKKLAEMYNYGLFDKDLAGYETVLAKTIGVNKLNEGNLKNAIVLGKSIADLFSSTFQGKRLTENQMRSAIQVIEEKMRYILHNEAKEHGSTSLKIADITRTYMDLTQRMTLNSFKQAVENPLSGKMESFFSNLGYQGEIPEVLNKQNKKIAKDIYKEMVLQKGANYGKVSSTFVNKGNLEMELDKMSDNQLVQGILSTVIGRSTLDAVDSAYKAKITQQKFTYNLIKILQQDRMVNGRLEKGMSKEDARNYVVEKLTGQSLKDAQETAKEIIDRINKGAGAKVFNDNILFVNRLASDIVNAALVNGQKISVDQVTASYNASYKAAGRGLGHVSNNFISEGIGTVSGKLETKINDAIKQKEYRKAAMLTYASIFFRNIANPFVGGGTNWVVLKVEKSGLGLLSGLGSMMSRGSKMDLMNEAGAKNLEKAMYENMKIKDKFIRGTAGGIATVVGAIAMNGITTTDEYRKWRLKNKWAAKYLDLVTPEVVLATMAKQSNKTLQYLQQAFNKNENFDKGSQAMKAIVSLSKGDSKASGQFGELAGSMFGAPAPWRLLRDGEQFWQGATGGEVYKVNATPSQSFLQGYFKGGMLDYLGYAGSNSSESKSDDIKLLESKGMKPLSKKPITQYHLPVSDNHPNVSIEGAKPHGIMTQEEFDKFNAGRAEAYPDILNDALHKITYYIDGKYLKGDELEKQYNYKIKDYIESRVKDLNSKLQPKLIDQQ